MTKKTTSKLVKKQQNNNKRRPQDWKPGQSGNLKGRPKKGYSITEWFKGMLASKPEIRSAIGKSIIKKALEGDTTAQKLVWNYMDGMPKSGELTGVRVETKDMKVEFIKHES